MNNDFLEHVKDSLYNATIEREFRRYHDAMVAGIYNSDDPNRPDPIYHHTHELFTELKRVDGDFCFMDKELTEYTEHRQKTTQGLPDYKELYEREKVVCHKLQTELDKYKKAYESKTVYRDTK